MFIALGAWRELISGYRLAATDPRCGIMNPMFAGSSNKDSVSFGWNTVRDDFPIICSGIKAYEA